MQFHSAKPILSTIRDGVKDDRMKLVFVELHVFHLERDNPRVFERIVTQKLESVKI